MANKKIKHIIAKLVGSSTEETMDVYDVDAVHTADVINNLTSNTEAAKKKPLSAYQGYVLNNNLTAIDMFRSGTSISNCDLNDMLTVGKYYSINGSASSTITNKPSQVAAGFTLYVMGQSGGYGSSGNKLQILTQNTNIANNAIYFRIYASNKIGPWVSVNGTALS